jgi:hypothetical protein
MGSTTPEVKKAQFIVALETVPGHQSYDITQEIELERGSELIEQIKDLGGFVSFRDDTMVWYPLHRIRTITIKPIKDKDD